MRHKFDLIPLLALLLSLMSSYDAAYAQKRKTLSRERSPKQELVYENYAYLPSIRSSTLHPAKEEAGFPVLYLGEEEPLVFGFDDLRGDIRNYYYSIEHCTAEWEPSNLSPLEYAEGFNEDRIYTYKPSVNTLQPYTRYEGVLPSAQVRPKLPGNYLLKVYEDADKKRLVLTRRFYVVNPVFALEAQIRPSSDNSKRLSHQKIDLSVHTGEFQVNNAFREVKVLVQQNQRSDVQEWLFKPSFVGNQLLRYEDQQTLDFPGGNEFRYVDLRSLKLASENIAELYTDSVTHAYLKVDQSLQGQAYASVFDEDGAFYLRNNDRANALEESDYALVHFTLEILDSEWTSAQAGDIYLVGAFNFFARREENRLQYNEQSKTWQVQIPLRQGLYDYDFVWQSRNANASEGTKVTTFPFSGSHFQTGNTYQILVYYRRPGTTWDELLGFREIQTSSSSNRIR